MLLHEVQTVLFEPLNLLRRGWLYDFELWWYHLDMAQGELIANHVFLALKHRLAVGDKTLLWWRERILEVDQDLFVTRMRSLVLC